MTSVPGVPARSGTSPEMKREVLKLKRDGLSVRKIAELCGLTLSSTQRILKRYNSTTAELLETVPGLPVPKHAGKIDRRKAAVTGRKAGKAISQIQQPKGADAPRTLPLPKNKPTFEKFMRWYSFPAYKGAHAWQLECHEICYTAKYDMRNVQRKAGKSILMAGESQFSMLYDEYDVLYLGWTDRRKEVSDYIYAFFAQNDLIANDQRTGVFHFRLKNGGKFDSYGLKDKEILGMHAVGTLARFQDLTTEERAELAGMYDDEDDVFDLDALKEYLEHRSSERKLWIIIDDPIDESFMHERHKELSLELRFDSTIYSIMPDKFSFVGTRKFEEDFFYFIELKFGKDLVVYRRGTGVSHLATRVNKKTGEDEEYMQVGKLLCPELFTDPHQPTYDDDIKAGKADLFQIRHHVGEYWFGAEFDQNPHPVTTDVFKNIYWFKEMPNPHHVDLICMTIDRAETTTKDSDYTGFVTIARDFKRNKYLVFHDYTDHIRFDDLLKQINDLYMLWKTTTYPMSKIKVVIEKQGGGYSLIQRAQDNPEFLFRDDMIEVHQPSNQSKLPRISSHLKVPVSEGYMEFSEDLRMSELMKEVTTFPKSSKVDAIDALATGYNEMKKIECKEYSEHRLNEVVGALKERNAMRAFERMKGMPKLR